MTATKKKNRRLAPVYSHYGCINVVHCNGNNGIRKEHQ